MADNEEQDEISSLNGDLAGEYAPVATESDTDPELPFSVVGIGGSAGGLEVYIEILKDLPSDTGMAFVIVPHLAVTQKSHLVEILSRKTAMPVFEISDGLKPQTNCVHVLPAGFYVTLQDGRLRLETRREEERTSLVIDRFFRSLARSQKNLAVGVVLSGMDSDGSQGLLAITGEGGITIVQDPQSARFQNMPRNGIAADHVDFILEPNQIAQELARLAKDFGSAKLAPLQRGLTPEAIDEAALGRIVHMLRKVSGMDFRCYKHSTLRRRIARRMMLSRIDGLDEYARHLQSHEAELSELQEDILIGVTQFFRDPEVFDAIKTRVFPDLFGKRDPEQPIRLWIAGCSSGEEVYSYAISLLEYFSGGLVEPSIQVFGTDASERAIERARAAVYPDSVAADVSPERLRRFFNHTERGYQIVKRVRDVCVFARQNLCTDPPFSKLDLISCRNVLIYLHSNLQKIIIPTFHYALRPKGYLVVGESEAIREFGDLFSLVDRKNKVYTRESAASHPHLHFVPRGAIPDAPRSTELRPAGKEEVWGELQIQRAADRIILARYGPPGVVINERFEIMESRGHTRPYLELAPGAASLQLLRMLREGLASVVEDAVRRAIDKDVPVTVEGLQIHLGERVEDVGIDVLPMNGAESRQRCYLVLFLSPERRRTAWTPTFANAAEVEGTHEEDDHLGQLQQDLVSTRVYLQSLVEERDTRNQELISLNEELQSSSEETQSINEEMETAKEELQSAVEELQTVNEELQRRNVILLQTGNDLTNLLNSVNLPVLMLDNELQIRQTTPSTQNLLNVRRSDIGRPIDEIRLNLSVGDLQPLLRDVLDTLGAKELEVQDKDGRWHLLRMRPYRTADNRIEGVVVVLVDIDQLRRSQGELEEARDFAYAVLETVQVPLAVLDSKLNLTTSNHAFHTLTGLSAEQVRGRFFPDLVVALWDMTPVEELLEGLRSNSGSASSFEIEHDTGGPAGRVLCVNGYTILAESKRLFLVTLEDITNRKRAEQWMTQDRERMASEIVTATRELLHVREELQALTGSLLTAQDDERRRVARELHDDITQRLALLQMNIDGMKTPDAMTPETFEELLKGLSKQVASLADDSRKIAHTLHPSQLDQLGLGSALKALAEEFSSSSGVMTTYLGLDLPDALPQVVEASLYRITQEALRNVAKHAGKTQAKILLECTDGVLRLTVGDLGVGFDPTELKRGLGLISMEERARLIGGSLRLNSQLGLGTTVIVDVPLAAIDNEGE
jgi:two-component system CheB/CheR fusion protein